MSILHWFAWRDWLCMALGLLVIGFAAQHDHSFVHGARRAPGLVVDTGLRMGVRFQDDSGRVFQSTNRYFLRGNLSHPRVGQRVTVLYGPLTEPSSDAVVKSTKAALPLSPRDPLAHLVGSSTLAYWVSSEDDVTTDTWGNRWGRTATAVGCTLLLLSWMWQSREGPLGSLGRWGVWTLGVGGAVLSAALNMPYWLGWL